MARLAGGTFAGSHSRSAHEITAGNRTWASIQPSSCSHPTARDWAWNARTLTPATKGRSRSWASCGGTCPVSASSEFRPVSTTSNGPSRSIAAANACAVAMVSLPAKAGSVTWTPRISTPRSSPQASASRSTSCAAVGPRVKTTTEDPRAWLASSTALLTARRQYALISSGASSRISRPDVPSSISSPAGICLTSTAKRVTQGPTFWLPGPNVFR